MGDRSKIDWTDATWNPLRGCSRVSAGCAHCYAEALAARFSDLGQWGHGIATRDGGWTGAVHLAEDRLTLPLRWKHLRRIFVTSISDPFHPSVSDEMLDRIFAVMTLARRHTFQILTKRPARMRAYLDADDTWLRVARATVAMAVGDLRWSNPAGTDGWWPLPNLWVGVSVENQGAADERIPRLLATPATKRFLSCEPLLGTMDLERPKPGPDLDQGGGASICQPWLIQGLDWVIAGGESGPNARPMHPDWARSLRDQCDGAGVPFFFKQWGEYLPVGQCLPGHGKILGATAVKSGRMKLHCAAPKREVKYAFAECGVDFSATEDSRLTFRVGKRAAGHLLDGVEHRAFPPSSSLGV